MSLMTIWYIGEVQLETLELLSELERFWLMRLWSSVKNKRVRYKPLDLTKRRDLHNGMEISNILHRFCRFPSITSTRKGSSIPDAPVVPQKALFPALRNSLEVEAAMISDQRNLEQTKILKGLILHKQGLQEVYRSRHFPATIQTRKIIDRLLTRMRSKLARKA